MKAYEIDFEFDPRTVHGDLLDIASRTLTGRERPSGIHLGHVIHYMECKLGIHGRKRKANISQAMIESSSPDVNPHPKYNYFEMGFVWETLIELIMKLRQGARYRQGVLRQLSVRRQGIWMTPDGFDTSAWRLQETKATWKSMNKVYQGHGIDNPGDLVGALESNFWSWTIQLMAYSRALGCTEADLFVFWVNGDYGDFDRVPIPKWYRISFSEKELEENWNLVITNTRAMAAEHGLDFDESKEEG